MPHSSSRAHRFRHLVLIPLLLAAAVVVRTPTTHAQTVINMTTPMQAPFQIFCGGRQIIVTEGQEHFLGTVTATPSGAYHVSIRWNVEGVRGASMVSGQSYVGTGTGRIDQDVNPSGSAGLDDSNNFHLISHGSGENFLIARLRATVKSQRPLQDRPRRYRSYARMNVSWTQSAATSASRTSNRT